MPSVRFPIRWNWAWNPVVYGDPIHSQSLDAEAAMRLLCRASVLFFLGGLTACVGAEAMTPVVGDEQTGDASYYADKFIGRTTASGERYDPDELTAAHPSLPFGTRVRVTRLDGGQRVVVRINDRGPFVRGRIIDLSHAAARRLDMVREGVVPVTIEVVNSPDRSGR
jgi:rare lipoprotein A